jgi:hypothetical protein
MTRLPTREQVANDRSEQNRDRHCVVHDSVHHVGRHERVLAR